MTKLLIVGIALFVILCLAVVILVLADLLAHARRDLKRWQTHAVNLYSDLKVAHRERNVMADKVAKLVLSRKVWTLKDLEREL